MHGRHAQTGNPTSAVKEYTAEGTKPATASTRSKFVVAIQDLAILHGTLTITDAAVAPELQSVREAVSELGLHPYSLCL